MFDPYYETKVNQKIPTITSFVGIVFIFIGISMISFTAVDINLGMTKETGSALQENSIWPTIGKGIWVGAIVSLFMFILPTHAVNLLYQKFRYFF